MEIFACLTIFIVSCAYTPEEVRQRPPFVSGTFSESPLAAANCVQGRFENKSSILASANLTQLRDHGVNQTELIVLMNSLAAAYAEFKRDATETNVSLYIPPNNLAYSHIVERFSESISECGGKLHLNATHITESN